MFYAVQYYSVSANQYVYAGMMSSVQCPGTSNAQQIDCVSEYIFKGRDCEKILDPWRQDQ